MFESQYCLQEQIMRGTKFLAWTFHLWYLDRKPHRLPGVSARSEGSGETPARPPLEMRRPRRAELSAPAESLLLLRLLDALRSLREGVLRSLRGTLLSRIAGLGDTPKPFLEIRCQFVL